MSPVGLDRIDQWPLVRPRLVADDARFQLSADRALVDTGVIGIFRDAHEAFGMRGLGHRSTLSRSTAWRVNVGLPTRFFRQPPSMFHHQ